jgi:hypothetical protein
MGITLRGDESRRSDTRSFGKELSFLGGLVMSTRARLNRIFAVIFILWGGAIIVSGIARGLPSGKTAYGAGQLTAFLFGFVMVGVGVWTLAGLRRRFAASSSDGYDDVDEIPGSGAPRRVSRIALLVIIPIVGVAVVAGGVGLWHHLRISRADELAVKYGAAPSADDATLTDRCIGVMSEDYNRSDDPRKAGLPPKVNAMTTRKMCALGVERGLVNSDGTMTEESGYDLMRVVIEEMGVTRFQVLVFNELAVSPYHLAAPGEVTGWDRCVAMGYSGWDAQVSKEGLPPRELFFKAVRQACSVGIKRGIVPASGVAVTDSPEGAALQQLIVETLLKLSR